VNIRKIEGKTGTSYKITVSDGRGLDGKQIRHYLTWTPDPGMTELRTKKALQTVAADFERKIAQGYVADDHQTFEEYTEYVLSLKTRTGAKYRTIERYRQLLERINPAIGYMKLSDIRPQNLNAFYAELSQEGIRANGTKATAKVDIADLLKKRNIHYSSFAEQANIAPSTVRKIMLREAVTTSTAEKFSAALQIDCKKLFTFENDASPLSNKTILEHHRLISTVLAQAEKEMLIPYNAAHKATPPKLVRKEVECFQPEDVARIRECLKGEPIKWRTITHLLLITGCRRGEIMGLHWDAIDWANQQIEIDCALLYSPIRGVYEDTTKTSTTRFIKLPVETINLLRDYRQSYVELRFKNGDQWHETGYVFVQDNGEPMNPDSITQWLGKFSQRNDLPHINPHKFRHTMASLLYYNGFDSITISKRLGHAKVSTTIDIYSHIIKRADEKAADCIADVVLRPPKQA